MLLKAGKGKFLEDLKDKPVDEVLPVLTLTLSLTARWLSLTLPLP